MTPLWQLILIFFCLVGSLFSERYFLIVLFGFWFWMTHLDEMILIFFCLVGSLFFRNLLYTLSLWVMATYYFVHVSLHLQNRICFVVRFFFRSLTTRHLFFFHKNFKTSLKNVMSWYVGRRHKNNSDVIFRKALMNFGKSFFR